MIAAIDELDDLVDVLVEVKVRMCGEMAGRHVDDGANGQPTLAPLSVLKRDDQLPEPDRGTET